MNIQLNRTIRINKSILKRFNNYHNEKSSFPVIVLDIVGVIGFTYPLGPYENIVAAIKASDESTFIPVNEDDFAEFVSVSYIYIM